MNTLTGNLQRRLAQLKKDVPGRGLERYPSVLQSEFDLPAELRSPVMETLTAGETIKTVISFPPQIQRGWHYVPKQALLFTSTGMIHSMASIWPGQKPQITLINASGILHMQIVLILLYGDLEVIALGHDLLWRVEVEFNTVAWGILFRPLRELLQTSKTATSKLPDTNAMLPALHPASEGLSLKFRNGVKIYVPPLGEALEELIFQPGVWRVRKFWPFVFREAVTANTILALTKSYLVVLKEELGTAHGWIIAYIPRNNTIGMKNQAGGLRNELTVQLEKTGQSQSTKFFSEVKPSKLGEKAGCDMVALGRILPNVMEK